MKPGAVRFLEYLKKRGIRTGIATSNSRELLDAVLVSLELAPYFDCCMTSCEAGAGKPAPDIYLKVAKLLGAAPSECLIFEDTLMGVQAGINAGITVCAMEDSHSAERKDRIMELADYYITSFDQVLDGTYMHLK
jgi:HAD superfamily hydrolase (TIGR01509 family)